MSIAVLMLFQRSILQAWKKVKLVSTFSLSREITGVSDFYVMFTSKQ